MAKQIKLTTQKETKNKADANYFSLNFWDEELLIFALYAAHMKKYIHTLNNYSFMSIKE